MNHHAFRKPRIAAVCLGLVLVVMSWSGFSAAARELQAEVSVSNLEIAMDAGDISTFTGDRFTITSTITNNGSEATPPLIANLTFVSLDGAYVDPEDWSPRRTVTLDPIGPGESIDQSWTVNPVLKGEVGVYVGILADSELVSSAGPVAASPVVHLHVTEQHSLNPQGVLPVVVIVPALLAIAVVVLQASRRWSTRLSN